MNTRFVRFAFLMLAALCGTLPGARPAAAQSVTVAPPVVVLDHKNRGGSVDLFNSSPNPVEVSISLLYGIPQSDSAGNVALATSEQPGPLEPSAAGWIEAYPRRVTILPGQRQTVRFLARPPADLPDREYWTRIVVSSKGAAIALSQPDSSGITATLNVELRTITTLLYRKGTLTTAIAPSGLRASVQNDSLIVRALLTPSGNAAWLGTAKGQLVGANGKVAAEFERPLGVYKPLDPSFIVPLDSVAPGTYKLRFELRSERSDLPKSTLLQTRAVRDSVDVIVPPRRP